MPIPPFTPTPAIGDAFVGRPGLVKNLRWRLARGESLAVIGGPKMGKTSLVRSALQGLTNHRTIVNGSGSPMKKDVKRYPEGILGRPQASSFLRDLGEGWFCE